VFLPPPPSDRSTWTNNLRSRVYRIPNLNTKLEWIYVLLFHVLVMTGIAILAVGVSSLEGPQPKPGDENMVKVGISLLTASWVVLLGWVGISVLPNRGSSRAVAHREGTIVSTPGQNYLLTRRDSEFTADWTRLAASLLRLPVAGVHRNPCPIRTGFFRHRCGRPESDNRLSRDPGRVGASD
jgi:hypothetical protein